MAAAEVVEGHPQRDSGPVALPLLTESIRWPCEPARSHSHAEVLAFHNRGTNSFGVGATHNRDHLHGGDFGGRVPRCAFAGRLVNPDELGEVRTIFKRVRNRGSVRRETIGRNLEVIRRGSGAQPFDENICGGLAAFAKGEVGYQLC